MLLTMAVDALAQEWSYRVRPGDTLWALAEAHLHEPEEWSRLLEHNGLHDPHALVPGSRLRIPVDMLRVQPAPARVARATGEVRLRARNGEVRTGQAGEALHSGDALETGTDSTADIRLADGSILRVLPDARVVFDVLSAFGATGMVDTRIRLQRGRIESEVAPVQKPAGRFQIDTAPVTASVRGTVFRSAAAPDAGEVLTEVTEGMVEVDTVEGQNLRLGAGDGLAWSTGAPREAVPTRLPARPQLEDLGRAPLRTGQQIGWRADPSAGGYRILYLVGTTSPELVASQRTPGASTVVPALPPGPVQLRVRAIAMDGLEGEEARVDTEILVGPESPFTLGPVDGAIGPPGRPLFRWTTHGSGTVHFQLARDADFQELLEDVVGLSGGRHRSRHRLSEGSYHWRVAAVDAVGQPGPFGPAQTLVLQPRPGAPTLRPASWRSLRAHPALAWSDAPHQSPSRRYQVQIAADESFSELVKDAVVEGTSLALDGLPRGRYLVRIRTVDSGFPEGKWSTAQAFQVGCRPCRVLGVAAAAGLVLLML
ncbi:MAG: FecR domain-containing protein [Xanthomonadales bacterium]|nr:FecR domain-containing protein [Xanthomonadales bacterium]